MAELEQRHRHEADAHLIQADTQAVKRGHQYGLAAALCAIAACLASIPLGAHWSVSIALVSLPVAGVIRDLINGRK